MNRKILADKIIEHDKGLNPYSAVIDFKRQNMTSQRL